MPKLVYFDAQGRAQAIRYLLGYKGIEFEDIRLTFEEWPATKAAETWGAGNGLPVYQTDDGTNYNQGKAILFFLAEQHGLAPQSPKEAYENMWFYETLADHEPPEARAAIFQAGVDQAILDKSVENFIAYINKIEARWSDGRAHASGANVTAADFTMLYQFTGFISNTNLRNPSMCERMMEHYNTLTHVPRVVDNIKGLCQAQVDALQPSWI